MRHTTVRLVFSPNATGPLHEPGRCPGLSEAVPSPAKWEEPYLGKKSLAVLNQKPHEARSAAPGTQQALVKQQPLASLLSDPVFQSVTLALFTLYLTVSKQTVSPKLS